MKESAFARTLREKLSPIGHWTRIENVAGAGIPDVNWYPGIDVWIELKATKTQQVLFQASQISWAKHRHKRGGKVWVMIRTEKEIILTDSRAVYDKCQYTTSNKPSLNVNTAKMFGVTFTKPFNWPNMIGILLDDVQFATLMGDVLEH